MIGRLIKSRLGILFVVACQLIIVEMLLEYRAYLRGWPSLLFGKGKDAVIAQKVDRDGEYGPTESFPFRSRVLAQPDKQIVFWIASSSMGVHEQMPASLIFPNRFHTLLKEKGRNIAVINASRVASGIKESADTLADLGRKWRPGYAILYNMSNDINRMSKAVYGPKSPRQGQVENHLPWQLPFLESTTAYALIKRTASSNLAQHRILWDELGRNAETELDLLVRSFVLQARLVGAEPVLCTFAVSHDIRSFGRWPLSVRSFLFSYNIYLSPKGWAATIGSYNEIIREVARRENVKLIDVYDKMAGNGEYFVDFVHFSPRGHERLAHILADSLADAINGADRR